MKKTLLAVIISAATFGVYAEQHDHAHTNGVGTEGGKQATSATISTNKAFAQQLKFDDVRAFENNNRGLIVSFDKETGDIIRNSFSFIDLESAANAPDTVNPSLWRQAVLNQAAEGLYEVLPGKVYQVRGTDLSSMTFIRGKTGWIVYDVLLVKESAAQSLKFFLQNVPDGGDLPVVAMLYSHSHADHFGGARAVQEAFPDVKVYGSKNITKEIVDENILAGNAMSRRSSYQYGATLKRHDRGIVDAALAKGLATGEVTYVKPDYELNHEGKFETLTIDGVEMVFMDASGTEAPSEMVTYIPQWKALWAAEVTYQGMHNVYTLRGAKVRDSLKWSKTINKMINLWGGELETLFSAHSAPIWGNEEINDFLKLQRDAYGFTHNQTLRLANNGYVMQDLGDAIYTVMPDSIRDSWHTNGYHGTYSHNARAVYNMYLGYFDMNPANLNPLPIKPEAVKFVEYMGGSMTILKKAQVDFDKGEYRFVATALNKLVQAEPGNIKARQLLADCFEQMGYQSEGAGWRNVYLTGAQELRLGGVTPGAKSASADVISEMGIANVLNYMAVKVDSLKAQHTPFTLSLDVTDTNEKHFVEMSNGNLNSIQTDELKPADATLTIKYADIINMLMGQTSLKQMLSEGKATLKGDQSVLGKLAQSSVEFDSDFEIVPLNKEMVDAELY